MADATASERPHLRTRLREKLPEILIEAGSVVLALLLALAVNAWHDNEQENERAETARAGILAELRSNQQELESTRGHLKEIIAMLDAAMNSAQQHDIHELKIEMGLSLLSAAAWHAALATQAIRRVDFAWMTHIARVYEVQENYLRVQNTALDQLATISPDDSREPRQIAASLIQYFKALDNIGNGLAHAYAEALDAKSP